MNDVVPKSVYSVCKEIRFDWNFVAGNAQEAVNMYNSLIDLYYPGAKYATESDAIFLMNVYVEI